MALDVAQRKTVERETLLELLGRLNFAATFYPMIYVLQRVRVQYMRGCEYITHSARGCEYITHSQYGIRAL